MYGQDKLLPAHTHAGGESYGNTVLYCTVLYCTVLYCTVLYCTVLFCTVPFFLIFFFSCCPFLIPLLILPFFLPFQSFPFPLFPLNLTLFLHPQFLKNSPFISLATRTKWTRTRWTSTRRTWTPWAGMGSSMDTAQIELIFYRLLKLITFLSFLSLSLKHFYFMIYKTNI